MSIAKEKVEVNFEREKIAHPCSLGVCFVLVAYCEAIAKQVILREVEKGRQEQWTQAWACWGGGGDQRGMTCWIIYPHKFIKKVICAGCS